MIRNCAPDQLHWKRLITHQPFIEREKIGPYGSCNALTRHYALILQEIAKPSIEERRALVDDLWDSIETEQALRPLSDELTLLDKRYRDSIEKPDQKSYTLEQIARRHGIKL